MRLSLLTPPPMQDMDASSGSQGMVIAAMSVLTTVAEALGIREALSWQKVSKYKM